LGSDKLNEIDEKIKAWIAGPEEKEIPPPALPYEEKLVCLYFYSLPGTIYSAE